jgi:hypothetical protein
MDLHEHEKSKRIVLKKKVKGKREIILEFTFT